VTVKAGVTVVVLRFRIEQCRVPFLGYRQLGHDSAPTVRNHSDELIWQTAD
jgi:hypothetical protein